MDVAAAVARRGGVARTQELRDAGISARQLAAAVRFRGVDRLRVGWFAVPGLADEIKRAHALGGRPACATVAALHGLWMLDDPGLHVEVVHTQSRLRIPSGRLVRVHWTEAPVGRDRRGQPIDVALIQMAACAPRLTAICAIDSALHRELVTFGQLARAVEATSRAAEVLTWCNASAESGVESIFRVRAAEAGHSFRVQVPTGAGRADFLFGDRLMVEVDGSEFHSGHKAFVADRERDAWHMAVGYSVLRLTYAQVVHRWHEVESTLGMLLARGEHLDRSRIRR